MLELLAPGQTNCPSTSESLQDERIVPGDVLGVVYANWRALGVVYYSLNMKSDQNKYLPVSWRNLIVRPRCSELVESYSWKRGKKCWTCLVCTQPQQPSKSSTSVHSRKNCHLNICWFFDTSSAKLYSIILHPKNFFEKKSLQFFTQISFFDHISESQIFRCLCSQRSCWILQDEQLS